MVLNSICRASDFARAAALVGSGYRAAHMPFMAAATDLMEWGPGDSPEAVFGHLMGNEVPIQELINWSPRTPAVSDDRPINEYYLFRDSLQP